MNDQHTWMTNILNGSRTIKAAVGKFLSCYTQRPDYEILEVKHKWSEHLMWKSTKSVVAKCI